MHITLSVLLSTLTIYSGASVLSLPPSLSATAAFLTQPHVRQSRDNSGHAAKTAGTTTIHLPQQHIHTVAYPQLLHWQSARPKKNGANFGIGGASTATSAYTGASSDDIARLSSMKLATNNNHASTKQTHPFKISSKLADVKDAHETRRGNSNRKLPDEYDFNMLLADATDRLEGQRGNVLQMRQKQQLQPQSSQWWQMQAPRIRAMQMKEFFTPLKYWAHHCQLPHHKCPQEYYRALLADRSRTAVAAAKLLDDFTASDGKNVKVEPPTIITDEDANTEVKAFAKEGDGSSFYESLDHFNDGARTDNVNGYADAVAEMANGDSGDGADYENEDNNVGNDILMLLSGEQDVMKFLSWALEQLYPYQHFAQLNGSRRAEYYHPGMFNWKKLNLSGHLEAPLLVDEPHYVIVRRERLEDDLQPGIRIGDRRPNQRSSLFQSIFNLNHGSQYKDDPFIPPRGRKHNLPDLDALLNRYETFVPNRGKRDKIKDIFKHDDLFFPNRGKKQKTPKAATLYTAIQAPETKVNIGGHPEVKRMLLVDNQADDNDDNNIKYSDTIDSNLAVTDDSSSSNDEESPAADAISWPTQQVQQRSTWKSRLPSNQERTQVNDLDLLTWLQQGQQQDRNDALTVQHYPPLLQEQAQQPKWQQAKRHRLQRLFGGADGIAGERSTPEIAYIGDI